MDSIDREREIDRWLDSALSSYSKVEPRAGLENRVLASLRADQARVTASPHWWVAGMAVALTVIAVTVWGWQSSREARRSSVTGIPNVRPHETTNISPSQTHSVTTVKHKPLSRPVGDVAVQATPKMEQFPSPQPLSEEEKLLMSYVARDPENAVLVARATAVARLRDREEEAAWAAQGNTE